MTPLEALLKDTKNADRRTAFITRAYTAANDGSVLALARWAKEVRDSSAMAANRDYRREVRRARRQALLWRLHIRRPKGTGERELQEFLDGLRKREK